MKKLKINPKSIIKIDELSREKTLTNLFLLPLINLKSDVKEHFSFVNAYLGDSNYKVEVLKDNRPNLFLLFRPKSLSDFTVFLDGVKNEDDNLLDYYDVGYGLMMLVYSFPMEFNNEYKHFLCGNYSKFTQEAIKMFPDTKDAYRDGKKVGKEYTIYHHIFNRTQWMYDVWCKRLGVIELDEDMEYWSKPVLTDEYFDINKIIENN